MVQPTFSPDEVVQLGGCARQRERGAAKKCKVAKSLEIYTSVVGGLLVLETYHERDNTYMDSLNVCYDH